MSLRHRRHRRRAISTVGLACMLPVLLGFVALAVDVGFMHALESETQNAADSSAMAGAIALGESLMTADASSAAHDRAMTFLHSNCFTQTSAPNTETVEVGRWDDETRTFNEGLAPLNAVRVQIVRNDAPLFFAHIFGMNKFNVAREAIARINPPATCHLWGILGVTMTGGSRTDSYDSTEGPYVETDARPNGDVCSCRDIGLSGDVTLINGDARHGEGYAFSGTGGSHATGSVEPLDWCIDPSLDFGDVATNNANSTITLSDGHIDPFASGPNEFKLAGGDHVTMGAGKYYFTSFELSGGSTITLTGHAEFYIAGDAHVSGGGIVNATANPWNLTIMVAGSQVHWSGSSDCYGSLIAPNADVTITGGGDWYGEAIGQTLTLHGGSDFHVDESLPLRWRPIPPPALVK